MANPLFRSASMDVFKSLLSKIDEISECQKQHCDNDNKLLHQITTDVKECANEALEMYKTKVQDLEDENKYLKSELEKFQQAYLRIIGC